MALFRVLINTNIIHILSSSHLSPIKLKEVFFYIYNFFSAHSRIILVELFLHSIFHHVKWFFGILLCRKKFHPSLSFIRSIYNVLLFDRCDDKYMHIVLYFDEVCFSFISKALVSKLQLELS